MNEEAINNIKDALREVMNLLVQRGQPISDDIKQILTQVMEHVASRITELRQPGSMPSLLEMENQQEQVSNEMAPPEQPPAPPTGGNVPPLDQAPHESSNINSFKYDPENEQLYVKFQDKYPGQNGPVYSYEGVPNYIYDIFRRGAVAPKTSGSNAWHTWKEGVTPSHGAAMNALLKGGGFAYQRIR